MPHKQGSIVWPKEIMRIAADTANDEIVRAKMPDGAAHILMTESLLVAGFGLVGGILVRILHAVEDLKEG